MEHGWQGRYVEGYELAKKYNLKFLFGAEAYWVKDRTEKDRSNCHIYIGAKNENGRQAINDILSEANITGYYVQPRIDISLILSLPSDDVFVTTACVAYWKYEDVEDITLRFAEHFKHFYLEVQYHNTDKQRDLNRRVLKLSREHNIPIIMGTDSHYILPADHQERTDYLASKGIAYPDEEGWYLDYPDGDEAYRRFANQCVLSHEEILEAINNTNIFLTVEDYNNPCFTKDIKMPTLYPNLTQEEKNQKYSDLVWQKWSEEKHNVQPERWDEYESEIRKEVEIVHITNHADYFLLDNAIVNKGKEMGGVITSSGRGSGVSFYTNKLLGFTDVDRISAKVKMYPERFMSPTRILETKSLADLDLNLGTVGIFAEAQSIVLGEGHSAPMLAYGTLKPKAAWKMYAKSQNVDFALANEVSTQIEKYEWALKHAGEDEKDDIDVLDYIDRQYQDIYKQSGMYLGVVSDFKIHPCLDGETLVFTDKGHVHIKDIAVGDLVLTHKGRFRKVVNTMSHLADEYYEVKVGGDIIKITGNHPVYTKENTVNKHGNILHRSEPVWKHVDDLSKNDIVGYANLRLENSIPSFDCVDTANSDTWWLAGNYLGDGYLSEVSRLYAPIRRISISCNENLVNEIYSKVKSLGYSPYVQRDGEHGACVGFYGQHFWRFLGEFGKYADKKIIPNFVFSLPDSLKRAFVEGYMAADGHHGKTQWSFVTTSKQIAYGMQILVNDVYHVPATMLIKKPTSGEINGKKFIRKQAYICQWSPYAKVKPRNVYADGRGWAHFTKTKIKEPLQVFNIEVEEDNSYTANNIVVHNCSYLLYQGNIRREIGLVKIKENLCCVMDGKWAEEYKFLKNDLLKVSVVDLIDKVYKRIGIPRHTVRELLELCPPESNVWDVYKKGCTLGVNQVEQTGTSSRAQVYSPTNISELCAFVAAIRPGFKSMYKTFEKREHFEYGIKALDELIQTPEMPHSFILYQEMSMAVLNFAGIPMTECYEIIKNIAKKRVDKVLKYKTQFIEGFTKTLIEQEGQDTETAKQVSHDVWQILEDSSAYSFNACVSGNTIIQKAGNRGRYEPTVAEMHHIKNNKEYARETGHKPLCDKYRRYGYGNALSMYQDGRIRKNHIVDIYEVGEKPTYEVVTESGAKVMCTINHKFPTPSGEAALSNLSVGDEVYVIGKYEKCQDKHTFTDGNYIKNTPKKGERGFQKIPDGASVIYLETRQNHVDKRDSCEVCQREYDGEKRFELHHKDLDSTHNEPENYLWCCVSCHKKLHYAANRRKVFEKGIPTKVEKITSISYLGNEIVYDIEMESPAHNFITDSGIITSNSHSYSVAIDSLYGAYLKTNYPLQFYEVFLNILQEKGEKDRLTAAKNEAESYFKIKFPPYRFGQDNRAIVADFENNAINNSIAAIKGFGSAVGDTIYECGKQGFTRFTDVLKWLNDHSVKSSTVEPLIKIDYFQQFGNCVELLQINEMFNFFKCGEAKNISKEKVTDSPYLPFIQKNSTGTNASGKELKSYVVGDIVGLIHDCEGYILSLSLKDLSYRQKAAIHLDLLGYVDLTTGKAEDRTKLLITDITQLKNQSGDVWGHALFVKSIGTGNTARLTLYDRLYVNNPIFKGDIVDAYVEPKYDKQNRKWWYLTSYEKI